MDPLAYLAVVAGALTTVAGLLYRELLRRAVAAEEDADYWRDQALKGTALADLASEELERRAKPRSRR